MPLASWSSFATIRVSSTLGSSVSKNSRSRTALTSVSSCKVAPPPSKLARPPRLSPQRRPLLIPQPLLTRAQTPTRATQARATTRSRRSPKRSRRPKPPPRHRSPKQQPSLLSPPLQRSRRPPPAATTALAPVEVSSAADLPIEPSRGPFLASASARFDQHVLSSRPPSSDGGLVPFWLEIDGAISGRENN